MPRAIVLMLVLVAAVATAGCKDLLVPQDEPVAGCRDGFRTCAGVDCYGQCMCESPSETLCEQECGSVPEVRVADLDEGQWDPASVAFEERVLELTNDARHRGACCGDEGCFDGAETLELDARLRSAARSHARDMAEQDYFDHDNQEGRSPFDRIREAGFDGCTMGENIAAGQETPEDVVQGWLDSPGHCANMLSPAFDSLGVGHYTLADGSFGAFWVQAFGG